MYSPQRPSLLKNTIRKKSSSPRKVSPYRSSPIKRTLPEEKLTLEEFLESKRKRFKSSTPSPPQTRKSTNVYKKSITLVLPPSPKEEDEERIMVCVRKRPLNKQENEAKESDIAPLNNARSIEILVPK